MPGGTSVSHPSCKMHLMSLPAQEKEPVEGPAVQENWRRALARTESNGAAEYALYSDSHVSGAIREAHWPYTFLNTLSGWVGEHTPGEARTVIVVRIESH